MKRSSQVPKCPIYAVGSSDRTQCARRADGVWFLRQRDSKGLWGKWQQCDKRPYEFGTWVDTRAGNAKLPSAHIEGDDDAQ